MSKTNIIHIKYDKISYMDYEKYRVLLHVNETKNLSLSAKQLGYTQSGLSRMLQSIESELGLQLFIRKKEGLTETDALKRLLPSIHDFVYAGDRLFQQSQDILGAQVGSLVIGSAYASYYEWLSNRVKDFLTLYPNISVNIINGQSVELLNKMNQHEIDCCIVSKRKGDFEWLSFKQDELVAMVEKSDKRSVYPLKDFETDSYIESYPNMDVDNTIVFKKNKIKPNIQFSTMDIHATYAMVQAGLGVAMNNHINRDSSFKNVKHISLEPKQYVEIGMAFQKDMTPVSKLFFEFITTDKDSI